MSAPSRFVATKHAVGNRGVPPDSFLEALVSWGKRAPAEIFAPNAVAHDAYGQVWAKLGPCTEMGYRRAVMLEVMRVHAGLESSWNWHEGVDKSNRSSQARVERQETGPFEVSFDSSEIAHEAMLPFLRARGLDTPAKFIAEMKEDHELAMEYYARLVRISTAWAGPFNRGEVAAAVRRDAALEFERLLAE